MPARPWRAIWPAAFIATSIAAAPGRAQSQARLTLGALYDDVARLSPRIVGADQMVRAADARIAGATRPPDPQVQLGLMNRSLPGLGPMPVTGMTQLQVMQMLPLAEKLSLSGDAARSRADATRARATGMRWDVRADAARMFYEIHDADRSLDLMRETLVLLREIAHTTESMYASGEGRQADVLRAHVEVARMAEDTLRMTAMRDASAGRLNALLTRDAGTPVASPELPRFPVTLPPRASFDSLALAGNPALDAAAADIRTAGTQRALARREIVPDLQVGVQLSQQGSEMGTERMASLMLGASVPIFAGSRQLKMRDEADAMASAADADRASLRADIRARIASAYADLVRARNLAALYRGTILPEAEAAAQSALASYRVGAVNLMTVLDDRMLVNRYRRELIGLEADEGRAWAELEMLTGRELFDARVAR